MHSMKTHKPANAIYATQNSQTEAQPKIESGMHTYLGNLWVVGGLLLLCLCPSNLPHRLLPPRLIQPLVLLLRLLLLPQRLLFQCALLLQLQGAKGMEVACRRGVAQFKIRTYSLFLYSAQWSCGHMPIACK